MNSAEIAKKAAEYHDSSLNCAQSVLCALSDEIQLDEETAKLIAAGFGGGFRTGKVCGAISGAVMAVGLALGKDDPRCGKAGSKVAAATKNIVNAFSEKYGSADCVQLIRSAGGQRRCGEFIAYCAELAALEIEKG